MRRARFLRERVAGGVCVAALATGRLDARDAAVAAMLGDAAALLADCATRCGEELVPYLRQSLLPALPLPPAVQAHRPAHTQCLPYEQRSGSKG